jgi:solute carrier family 39 (zinc transporter), member 7
MRRLSPTSTQQRYSWSNQMIQGSEVQSCTPIQKLNALKIAMDEQDSPIMRQVFTWLFPFGPAWNSILGTFYISSYVNPSIRFIGAEL